MSNVYIALIDDNSDTITLVRCEDSETADRIGQAAVWGDGGVSAYRVPTEAIDGTPALLKALQGDSRLYAAIEETDPLTFPVRIAD